MTNDELRNSIYLLKRAERSLPSGLEAYEAYGLASGS